VARREAPLTNVNAEKLFLGGLLLSPHVYWTVESRLRADQFSNPIHKDIYLGISDIITTGGKISIPVLAARLPEEAVGPDNNPVEMSGYLAALRANAEVAEVNPVEFAGDIAELAARRQLATIGERLTKTARSGEKVSLEAAADAEASLIDVMRVTSPKRPQSLPDLVARVGKTAERVRKGAKPNGIGWGLKSIDDIMGPMLPGDSGYILAIQAEGKTAFAMQVAQFIAEQGPVLFIEMEMMGEVLAARAVSAHSSIPVRNLEEGNLQPGESDLVSDAVKGLSRSKLWILDEKKMSIRQIRAQAMAMKRTDGLVALFIDQLDKIKAEGRHKDKFERLAEVTGDLKDLGKELGVPVITLCQRTRFSQRRDDATPQIDDADAPTIERDADWVIAIWRKVNWLQRNKPSPFSSGEKIEQWEHRVRDAEDLAEAIVLKHRRRKAFQQRQLKWIGHLTRFEERVTQ
jgi:replicative DNA helicase